MSELFVVPKDFNIALAGSFVTAITITALTFRVGKFRKEAGVEYPALYADDADARKDKSKMIFNCAQRGVANLQETYPQVLLFSLISGLAYPRVSGALSVLYSLGAVSFAVGYSTGEPDKRYSGGFKLGFLTRIAPLAMIVLTGKYLIEKIEFSKLLESSN